ncbi:MAG: GNAT family N-acetyltransferase, partial [Alphaproteobacteria bacterium]|nr:GNAT family N-acetyltransferase [Alphaproteobacteria bacterium]
MAILQTEQTKYGETTPLSTRPLSSLDLETVIALDATNSPQSRRGFFESRLKAATDTPQEYVYVGICEGETLVGFAMARLLHGEFGQANARASLDAIGVAHGLQNHGAGHQLLAAVKQILTHKGVSALETQVDWADRTLLGFLGNSGFKLAPRIILRRQTDPLETAAPDLPPQDADSLEVDHSSPDGDDFTALSRDLIPVRSMTKADLGAIIRIDGKHSGQDRSA